MKRLFILLGFIGSASHALALANDLTKQCQTNYSNHLLECQDQENMCNKINDVATKVQIGCGDIYTNCTQQAQENYAMCEKIADIVDHQ